MNCGLPRVIERFPQLAASIQDRFQDDEGFREMCRDYADALEALQRWEASDSPQRAARVEEYRELDAELRLPPPDTEERLR